MGGVNRDGETLPQDFEDNLRRMAKIPIVAIRCKVCVEVLGVQYPAKRLGELEVHHGTDATHQVKITEKDALLLHWQYQPRDGRWFQLFVDGGIMGVAEGV